MGESRAKKFEETISMIIKQVDPGYGQKHVEDRFIAVSEFVKDVVRKVEETTPQLKVSEVLPVDGFNEGTKIHSTDEFDYLVVIDELSKPGAVVVERDENTRDGNVKLRISPGTDPNGRWEYFCKDGYLRCFEESRQTLFEDAFGLRVLRAVPELKQNKYRRCFGSNSFVEFFDRPEFIYSRTRPVEHIAVIKDVEVHYPNVLLNFIFGEEEVTTDLCPAIRYYNVHDLFNPEYCFNETLVNEVISKGSLLLVGKGSLQFRVTFTKTEVDYMKNKISKGHKNLYIFLKVIASYFGDRWSPPSSYTLKVTCIKHDLVCQNSKGDKTLLECFTEIVDDIKEWNAKGTLPSIFDRRLDLISYHFDDDAPYFRRHIVAPVFEEIVNLCYNLTSQLPEQLLEQIKDIVEKWEGMFPEIRDSMLPYTIIRH